MPSINISSNVLIPFEALLLSQSSHAPNHEHRVAIADERLDKGWRRRPPYPFIPYTVPFLWKSKETKSYRMLEYDLQSFKMFVDLFLAYDQSRNIKYLQVIKPIISEWLDLHGDESASDVSPFAWYDMAVGHRCYRLAYFLDAAERAGLLEEHLRSRLWQSLLKHHAYLADDSRICFHNNHGYYQAVGQMAMGRRFTFRSPEMAQAYKQGRERFNVILHRQFTEDGIHKEHSPDYHRMVYETLSVILQTGLIADNGFVAFAEKIESALSWFLTPSLEKLINNFGDSDLRPLSHPKAEILHNWRTEEMKYLFSDGKEGTAPTQTLAVFEQGGYVVYRNLNGKGILSPKSSYLAQHACFHSRTHKHADDLTVIWSDRGSAILVDSGRYGYVGKTEVGSELWANGYWYADPNRLYCESTRAHNTLEFDDTDYPRKGVKPYGSAVRRYVDAMDSHGIVAWETECKHFKTIARARLLIFKPGQWLIVVDWFNDNLKNNHSVKQWFHIDPDILSVKQNGEQYCIHASTFSVPLRVASLLAGPEASRLYKGESEPRMQGWVSRQPLEMLPNFVFCYELASASTGAFATLFVFSESLSVDASKSKINTSGRKGYFCWDDDKGHHRIAFDRPKEGDLTVSYDYQKCPDSGAAI